MRSSLLLVPVLLAVLWLAWRPPPAAESTPIAPMASRPDAGASRLVVRVEGLGDSRGGVALALFEGQEAFDAETKLRSARLDPREPTWEVEDLPAGIYAIKAYHDRDGNGALTKGAFGVPSEPYGFSNDARGTFGPPTFDEAAFRFEGAPTVVTVRVR